MQLIRVRVYFPLEKKKKLGKYIVHAINNFLGFLKSN